VDCGSLLPLAMPQPAAASQAAAQAFSAAALP